MSTLVTAGEAPIATASAPPRVLFAGGGTGGHLLPGVEVAREIARLAPGARVLFAGAGKAIEATILEEARMERVTLPAAKAGTAEAAGRQRGGT